MDLVIACSALGLALGWVLRHDLRRLSGRAMRRIALSASVLLFLSAGSSMLVRQRGWWLSALIAVVGIVSWNLLAEAKVREEREAPRKDGE